MNITRNGKIARLPRAVRQELNRRLDEGEQGKKLVVWLNALPEVRAIVAAEFGGKPIRAQSLSEWRKGGYRDWLAQQEALEVAGRLGEDAAEWSAEGRPPLTDTLALWLAARYAVAARRVAESEGPEGWRLLRELCGDIVELRRGDHSAQRIKMEKARIALEGAQQENYILEHFPGMAEPAGGLAADLWTGRAQLRGAPPEGEGDAFFGRPVGLFRGTSGEQEEPRCRAGARAGAPSHEARPPPRKRRRASFQPRRARFHHSPFAPAP